MTCLSDEEKTLFAHLAVFHGGSTLEAAQAVVDADLDALQSLVDKSLVRHSGDRFWMLETIGEFASERLAHSDAAGSLARCHAEHYLALGEEAEPHLLSAARDWFEHLGHEHENLRAALDYFESNGEIESALRLAGAIQEFWDQRGHHEEALRRYVNLLKADDRPTAARADSLLGAGMMATKRNDLAAATRWHEEALDLHRSFGNEYGIATSLWGLGYIKLEKGEYGPAEAMLREAYERMRGTERRGPLAWLTRTLAFTYYSMGDFERSRPLNEENLRHSRESGDKHLEAATLGGLSAIALDEGRRSDAVAIEMQSLAIVEVLVDELLADSRLCSAARILAGVGRWTGAAQLIGYLNARYEEMGTIEPWVARLIEETLAKVREHLDEYELSGALADGASLTRESATQIAMGEMRTAGGNLGA